MTKLQFKENRFFKIGLFSIWLFCTISFSNPAIASRIDRGFEALQEYNYFKAKRLFERTFKRHTSAAAYGLSVIYFRNDNPFHDLELAYHYSLKSLEKFHEMRPRRAEKLRRIAGFSERRLINHRNAISEVYFEKARQKNTIDAYVNFMARHPWSPLVDSAMYYREDLAFHQAIARGKSSDFEFFLRYYKGSRFDAEIIKALEWAQFKETTADQSLRSFETFIAQYPDNPHVYKAHNQIYEQVTEQQSISTLDYFIRNYPNNPNVNEAWSFLYKLSISDYSKESITNFIEKYPDFPFLNKIDEDLKMVEKQLLPFKRGDNFGFMDEDGRIVIGAKFDYAGIFSNGLAAVSRKGKVGYITKSGEIMIPFQFDDGQDFQDGRAVVEKDGYFGWIDRIGNYILPLEYEDIGNISQGITFAYKDGMYSYYNINGEKLFDRNFDEAFAFSNGTAKVISGDSVGFIRLDGSFEIVSTNGNLRIFSDSIYVIEFRDSANLIRIGSDSMLLVKSVDRIGVLQENRAIVELDGKFGYIDSLGNQVIPTEWKVYPNFFQFAQFMNGHARIAKDGKFGLINAEGKRVFPTLFTNIGHYNFLTPVTRGNKWGYADTNARLQIRYIYDYAYSFENEYAAVQMDEKMGWINREGELVLPIEYEYIRLLNNDLIQVKQNSLFAVFATNGTQITAFKFSRINWVQEDLLQLESSDEVIYFNAKTGKIIAPAF